MAQLPPLVEPPPVVAGHSTHHSMETLVVVLAAITIIAVVAGIIARLCGGEHSGGEHDVEGWVERKCRSCIDGGLPTAPPPLVKEAEPKPPGLKNQTSD
ncbi:uncharacterized protein LOC130990560 [Salvia miltiorrhiza]|uniref:uncharacterized protein LOC130990560 n=1 Tax=Salvia miltiorrhiza TaxID=226208 RepID=UPI0025AC1721|nr:uncharacterized protein LOC130990560 [Salvia miltiorrhiza]